MIYSLLRLARPYYTLPLSSGLAVIGIYAAGGSCGLPWTQLALGIAALYFVLSGGYILNDVCDIRVDSVNTPGRVLPSGRLSIRTAITAAVFYFAIGIGLAALCGWRFFILMCLTAAGLAVYDIYSKRWGIFKDIFAAALTTMLYPLGCALVNTANTVRFNTLYIHPVWLFLTTVGYQMLKDIGDTEGDALAADSGQIRRRGSAAFLRGARILLFAASLLTLLPYVLGYCRQIYLASSLAAMGLVIASMRLEPRRAIVCIYASVFIITAGSLADLLLCGL